MWQSVCLQLIKHLKAEEVYSIGIANTLKSDLQKDGEQKPGSKGLALTQEQWQLLATSIPSLSEAAEENNIEYFVELGNKRRASVTSYKGGNNVDLREFYDKDGNMAPGRVFLRMFVHFDGFS